MENWLKIGDVQFDLCSLIFRLIFFKLKIFHLLLSKLCFSKFTGCIVAIHCSFKSPEIGESARRRGCTFS